MVLKCKHKSNQITPNLGYNPALITFLIVSKSLTPPRWLSTTKSHYHVQICQWGEYCLRESLKCSLCLSSSCKRTSWLWKSPASHTTWQLLTVPTELNRTETCDSFCSKISKTTINILWILGHLIPHCKYGTINHLVLAFLRMYRGSPK